MLLKSVYLCRRKRKPCRQLTADRVVWCSTVDGSDRLTPGQQTPKQSAPIRGTRIAARIGLATGSDLLTRRHGHPLARPDHFGAANDYGATTAATIDVTNPFANRDRAITDNGLVGRSATRLDGRGATRGLATVGRTTGIATGIATATMIGQCKTGDQKQRGGNNRKHHSVHWGLLGFEPNFINGNGTPEHCLGHRRPCQHPGVVSAGMTRKTILCWKHERPPCRGESCLNGDRGHECRATCIWFPAAYPVESRPTLLEGTEP